MFVSVSLLWPERPRELARHTGGAVWSGIYGDPTRPSRPAFVTVRQSVTLADFMPERVSSYHNIVGLILRPRQPPMNYRAI
jgi:hypothetical protein